MDNCIFESDELTAKDVLEMFLNCSDEKVLHLFLYFVLFMERFCRYNPVFMEEMKQRMIQRRNVILGYQ